MLRGQEVKAKQRATYASPKAGCIGKRFPTTSKLARANKHKPNAPEQAKRVGESMQAPIVCKSARKR
eukprot:1160297-Pelagomonas_calceolata.AAC.1